LLLLQFVVYGSGETFIYHLADTLIMNGIDFLEKIATANYSTEKDNQLMQVVLHKIGFNRAVVVCGIVYLEGKGTLTCPPQDIHTTAKQILRVIP
jgi:hypothetical protein